MTTPYHKRALSEEQDLRDKLAAAQLKYLANKKDRDNFDLYRRALKAYSDYVLRGIPPKQEDPNDGR